MIGFVFLFFVCCAVKPAQGATGGSVIWGIEFKWFPLCEFSLFDTPLGQFSGSLGSWSQCSHSKGSRLDLWSGTRFRKWFVMAFSEIKTNIPKQETKDEPHTNRVWQLQNQANKD